MATNENEMLERADGGELQRDETDDLISSEKLAGTAVYNRAGERLGTVHHLMVGKRDGRVRYAVMNFGGFLGIGEACHPLPWEALTYGSELGGYIVDIDRDRLEGAPYHDEDAEPVYDPAFRQRLTGYYGL